MTTTARPRSEDVFFDHDDPRLLKAELKATRAMLEGTRKAASNLHERLVAVERENAEIVRMNAVLRSR